MKTPQTNTPTPINSNPHSHTREAGRRRGSVIILVVVVIGLMAFIGATFLQVARVQRAVIAEPVDNIDLVLQSVRQEIALQLKGDIFDPATGQYFSAAAGIEPYDRAWVNTGGPTYPVLGIDGNPVAGPMGTANGGEFDDTWLASALPYDNGGTWTWRKLTTLTGGFYDVENDGSGNRYVDTGASGADPTEVGGTAGVDYDVPDPYADPNLVDADADGLPDSRWERAPIALKDGVEYFMAVRVTDLAGFLNANVATSPVAIAPGNGTATLFDDFDESAAGTDALRGIYPSETNLAGYVNAFGGTYAEMGDLLLNGRGIPDASWIERERFWRDVGRRLGNPSTATNPYLTLNAGDETELRYRGGTVDLVEASGTLEAQMPTFMADYAALGGDGISDNAEADLHYGYGNVPRTRMTVSSAEALFAPVLPTENVTERILKFPLNSGTLTVDLDGTSGRAPADVDRDTALVNLASVIESVYNSNPPNPLPGGFPFNATGTEQLGQQLAVSLQDYRDQDNRLTIMDPDGTPNSGDELVGFEPLPAITEVYVHQEYQFSEIATGDFDGEADDPDFDGAWDKVAGAAPSYGIEIRNPFNRPISLVNVFLTVGGASPTAVGISDQNSDTLIDLFELIDDGSAGREFLDVDEVLILYRNDGPTERIVALGERNQDTPGQEVADADSMVDDTNDAIQNELSYTGGFTYTYAEIDLPIAGEWPNDVDATVVSPPGGFNGDQLVLRLAATTTDPSGSTDLLTYQEVFARSMPESFDERIFDQTATPDGATSWAQASSKGNAHKVNMHAIPREDFAEVIESPSPAQANPQPRHSPSGLGWPSKFAADTDSNYDRFGPGGVSYTVASATGWDLAGPLNDQWIFAEDPDNRIQSVGELAQVIIAGPSLGQTIAERIDAGVTGTPNHLDGFRLDLDVASIIGGGQAAWNVNHAQFLMQRVTTYSPHADGIDNNGDGDIDDDREQTVAGRLNIHSAEFELLEDVLPFANGATRTNLATAMSAVGNNVGVTGTGSPNLWTLFNDGTYGAVVKERASAIGDNQTDGTSRIDFLSNEIAGNDSVGEDREEELLYLNKLHQIATTRSDVYVAYILVHGYQSTQFNLGPVEVGREIVLFDRSGLITNDDAVINSVLYRFP